jgi:uncharacterized phage protein (TIGR01671 family)
MREFKFRAWDLDHKWMDTDFFIKSNGIPHDAPSRTFFTPNIEIDENPSLVVMQFTGLKDANGVDIYEGDLLEVRHRSIAGFVREKSINVYYEESDAAFLLKLPRSEYPMYLHEVAHGTHITIEGCSHTCKVIGNIYENPELLEVQHAKQ